MERRETFILILFHDPDRVTGLRGRVRHVASGTEVAFIGINELAQALGDLVRREHQDAWARPVEEGFSLPSPAPSKPSEV
ncbi:MAG: hypothetical protein D6759_03885 [Chloroflexi bacterium]|nr:MAG: hypothetical protein D6759_03885 [Chloroflexota bacterium]